MVGHQAVGGGAHQARLPELAFEQLPGPGQGLPDGFWRSVLQRNPQPLQGAPGSDVATHGAGADHVHPVRREIAPLALGFEPLAQLEYANQVAGGGSKQQVRHLDRLTFVHCGS